MASEIKQVISVEMKTAGLDKGTKKIQSTADIIRKKSPVYVLWHFGHKRNRPEFHEPEWALKWRLSHVQQ